MTPGKYTGNTLFYGDNLPILREYIADESVDLIYLDPPFNSNRSYNVLFKDESGNESEVPDRRLRRHLALGRHRRAGLPGPDRRRAAAGGRHDGGAARVHRRQPDDGLPGDDGRPAGGAAPGAQARPAACTCTATRRPATT